MSPMDVGMHNKYVLLTVGRKFTLPACRATATAIDRYLLPAPDLSSKPAGHRCSCCRSTGQTGGQTGGRTDTRPFYDVYRILCGPQTRSSCGDRTFAAAGLRLWNSLPVQLRNPDITYGLFRRQLRGHLFGSMNTALCDF